MLPQWFRFNISTWAVGKLAGGATVAQLIVIVAAPFLTRLYSPAELGVFAFFLALVGPAALLGTGGYAQAVVPIQSDRKSLELVGFAITLCAIVSISLLAVIFVGASLGLFDRELLSWIWWLPVAAFIAGANQMLVSYANRKQQYGLMSWTTVVQSAVASFLQVALGVFFPSPQSLIGGSTAGSLSANVRLTRNWIGDARASGVSLFGTISAARLYARFPRFTLPAGLLSQAHLAGLPIALGIMFGSATLGLWSIAQRVVATPLSIVGNAVGAVYFQRAVLAQHSRGASMRLYRKVLFRLFLLSLIPFLSISVLAPELFQIAFGSEWRVAGTYAQVMIPWLWFRFLVSPLSTVTLVYKRNRLGLLLQGVLVTLTAVVVLVGWAYDWGFLLFLSSLSWVMAAGYFSLLMVYTGVVSKGHSGDAAQDGRQP